ncbi:MAG TPA: class I SAM-dependent methyltransferase [Rhodocyclaceae bacterium]|nr:class I SAM-dependent methyltransferase [Rhodocyclaceae bacterium]
MKPAPALPWHRPCPICLADQPASLHLNAMAPVDGLDLSYRVCRCAQCGFHYAADLALPETYETYYRNLSKYDVPRMGDFPSPLERLRASASLDICRPHIPGNAAVADIGCGRGALLHAFKEAGHDRLYGLDPAPASAASLGLGPVLQGSIEEAHRLPLGELDLVCLMGVLEHLPQLREDMNALAAALPKQARILIEVPALERFLRPRSEPFGELSLEHVQYFSKPSLVRLMAALGYEALTTTFVALDGDGACDSLFGLFARADAPMQAASAETCDTMDAYIAQSRRDLASALASLTQAAPQRFAIYGAGSHSARLLPALEAQGLLERVAFIADGNPNLQGKRLGSFTVVSPQALDEDSALPVLISSYRAQAPIAKALQARHPQRPLLKLYPDDAR